MTPRQKALWATAQANSNLARQHPGERSCELRLRERGCPEATPYQWEALRAPARREVGHSGAGVADAMEAGHWGSSPWLGTLTFTPFLDSLHFFRRPLFFRYFLLANLVGLRHFVGRPARGVCERTVKTFLSLSCNARKRGSRHCHTPKVESPLSSLRRHYGARRKISLLSVYAIFPVCRGSVAAETSGLTVCAAFSSVDTATSPNPHWGE